MQRSRFGVAAGVTALAALFVMGPIVCARAQAAAPAAGQAPAVQALAPGANSIAIKYEDKVNYKGSPNNIRLSNDTVELILATDYGPRILRYAPIKGRDDDNVFAATPDTTIKTELGEWRLRGGHRLWHAPESSPRTYIPDNDPVTVTRDGNTVKLTGTKEPGTNIQKEIWVTLDGSGSHVTVTHRMTNLGLFPVELACWSISAMNRDGLAIIPQEPYKSQADNLQPSRQMILWSYTNLRDSRWFFGQKFITLRQDVNVHDPQKLGFQNRQGWCAYHHNDILFVKRFGWDKDQNYPDYGCNNEAYTNDQFLELESLGPLQKVQPGETITHVEQWWLYPRIDLGSGEVGLSAVMLPIVTEMNRAK